MGKAQVDEFEGFAALKQLVMAEDGIEQENQIDAMKKILEEEEQQ